MNRRSFLRSVVLAPIAAAVGPSILKSLWLRRRITELDLLIAEKRAFLSNAVWVLQTDGVYVGEDGTFRKISQGVAPSVSPFPGRPDVS